MFMTKPITKVFPKVHSLLHQSSSSETVSMLDGQADIGLRQKHWVITDLIFFPYYTWHHAIIVPAGHPLQFCHPLTIETIEQFPIITYRHEFRHYRKCCGRVN